jgi:hypothetical protein
MRLARLSKPHPAVLVTAGLLLICLLQLLPQWLLLGASALLLMLAAVFAAQRLRRILRRLRWIALSILVLFAWQTPGTLIIPALSALSPSWDGLALTLFHLAGLAAIGAVVSLLMRALNEAAWVCALYALSAPFARFGFPAARLAVRMMLVLESTAGGPGQVQHGWREWLSGSVAMSTRGEWQLEALQAADRVWIAALWAVFAGACLCLA